MILNFKYYHFGVLILQNNLLWVIKHSFCGGQPKKELITIKWKKKPWTEKN